MNNHNLNANSKLGIIRNTFHDLSKENFIVLYKLFVHPILEYCSTIWSPNLIMYRKEDLRKEPVEWRSLL